MKHQKLWHPTLRSPLLTVLWHHPPSLLHSSSCSHGHTKTNKKWSVLFRFAYTNISCGKTWVLCLTWNWLEFSGVMPGAGNLHERSSPGQSGASKIGPSNHQSYSWWSMVIEIKLFIKTIFISLCAETRLQNPVLHMRYGGVKTIMCRVVMRGQGSPFHFIPLQSKQWKSKN